MSKSLRMLAAILLACCTRGAIAEPADPGEALYQTQCASCHENPETRSPDLQGLQRMPLSRILSSMEFGKMQLQAAGLSAEQRLTLAQWLAQAEDSGRDDWIASHACEGPTPAATVSPGANWGFGNDNARHVTRAVTLNPRNIDKLELAWSLALPQVTDMRSQPVLGGELLFLGTQTGSVLALDRRSGCVHWQFRAMSTIRSALTLDHARDGAPTLFFADDLGTVYALAAKDGRLRWSRNVRLFQTSVISGAITSHDGRLFVPISSFEVAVAGMPTHECCRSHGGVVALNAANGELLWEYHTTPDAEKTVLNRAGTQMWGPSGASVWSTPTVDAKRGLVYVGTGENLSRPATDTSDAVIAIDIESGTRRWHFQALADDVWNGACQLGGANCPENPGPDWDIGPPWS
jgi:polyvinyl alcohol dehydrogenase (cytochrome)